MTMTFFFSGSASRLRQSILTHAAGGRAGPIAIASVREAFPGLTGTGAAGASTRTMTR